MPLAAGGGNLGERAIFIDRHSANTYDIVRWIIPPGFFDEVLERSLQL